MLYDSYTVLIVFLRPQHSTQYEQKINIARSKHKITYNKMKITLDDDTHGHTKTIKYQQNHKTTSPPPPSPPPRKKNITPWGAALRPAFVAILLSHLAVKNEKTKHKPYVIVI